MLNRNHMIDNINNMKYLKLFENFNKSEIDDICKKYNIQNYTINSDGSIDVEGTVWLCNMQLKEMPLKFNRVSGWFDCSDNQLTTLEGCPNYVGDSFDCSSNYLTTLEGCPKEIKNFINIGYNFELADLNGLANSNGLANRIFFMDTKVADLINMFGDIKFFEEYQETYNFLRKDCKIVKHRLIDALKDFNEYYKQSVELPQKIEGYTYI
jgi:hypothetical protein